MEFRRRRAAMASLLAQLAKGMIFAHRNFSELTPKRSKKQKKRRGSHVCEFSHLIIYCEKTLFLL
jgi:hypothetical protein